ncbi:MAG: alpha-hydroxy-acid oxidizing protein [Christensenellaceae bacterium]|jgi:isopentenyl diphosphate isomerase/L-lactate dehydrogenase-like FMN-dependent dehydrogenase|nr:alpha-hydroxy-acid oxidizing protein [Christensenellaceae bacterium]
MSEKPVKKINGGDTEKITRDYFDSLLLEMRHIDAVEPDTALKLYGHEFKTPIMLAALSHLDRVHEKGMVESARGMAAAGGVMWSGMGTDEELEEICATGAKTVKIIKPHANNDEIFRKMEHAAAQGCIAVGMDIDHQFGSKNRRGYVLEFPMAAKMLDDIKAFVRGTKLPFVIKGVLSAIDAQKCLDAGVRGIVVSHHHGMVDYALPPLQILPKIVQVIRGQIPVFVDCGLSRGLDAFKALALGATAVSIGRAAMGPLGETGWEGVRDIVNEMTNELNWAMAVTCSPTIDRIDPSVLHHKNG